MNRSLKRKKYLLKAATLSTGAALASCSNDIIAVGNPDGSFDGPLGTVIQDSGHFDGPLGTVIQDSGHEEFVGRPPFDGGADSMTLMDGPFGVVAFDGGDSGDDGSKVGLVIDSGGLSDVLLGTIVGDGGQD